MFLDNFLNVSLVCGYDQNKPRTKKLIFLENCLILDDNNSYHYNTAFWGVKPGTLFITFMNTHFEKFDSFYNFYEVVGINSFLGILRTRKIEIDPLLGRNDTIFAIWVNVKDFLISERYRLYKFITGNEYESQKYILGENPLVLTEKIFNNKIYICKGFSSQNITLLVTFDLQLFLQNYNGDISHLKICKNCHKMYMHFNNKKYISYCNNIAPRSYLTCSQLNEIPKNKKSNKKMKSKEG